MRTFLTDLRIVEEISRSANLRSAVDECDKQTISAFRFLEDVVKSREMKVFHALRNRATFHYDRQLPLLSFEEIAEAEPERNGPAVPDQSHWTGASKWQTQSWTE
jgi:hypothetical protein